LISNKELGVLKKIVDSRASSRVYNKIPVDKEVLESILQDLCKTPSSCNRQTISLMVIEDRDRKELLSGLLVGGVGWIHRADKILLLFANGEAYKENLFYMPYLDAGVMIQQLYLSCTANNVSCCYINPNIREINQEHFKKTFSNLIFCGALALGHSDTVIKSPKRESCLL